MEATAEVVENKYPGLKQAINNLSDGPEVVVETAAPDAAKPEAKEGEEGYVAPAPVEVVVEDPAKVVINPDDLTDEQFEAALKKRTGKTLSDLNPPAQKTAEELAAEKEQRKNEAFAWALENKIVTKADYDKKNADLSKTDREIVLQLFTASLQAEDKDLTPAECEEIFIDTYHESEDASDRLKAIGQKDISRLAQAFRKENSVPDYESQYESTLTTQNQYKAYKGLVKEVVADIPKELAFSLEFEAEKGKPETLSYKIPVDQKVLDKIVSDYSSGKEFSIRNIENDGKFDKKVINAEITDRIKAKLFDTVIPEILKKNAEDVRVSVMAKVKNIPNQPRELNNGRQNIGGETVKVQSRAGMHQAIENQRN